METGVSEGALYHHFNDKTELLHAVVELNIEHFHEVLVGLPLLVGQQTVRENLEYILLVAFNFQFKIVPIVCSLYADHKLLTHAREILIKGKMGPQYSIEMLTVYLQAEQRLGRVTSNIDSQTLAETLLSGSFHKAILDHLLQREISPDVIKKKLREIVQIILAGNET